jgi:hypothetical protein
MKSDHDLNIARQIASLTDDRVGFALYEALLRARRDQFLRAACKGQLTPSGKVRKHKH